MLANFRNCDNPHCDQHVTGGGSVMKTCDQSCLQSVRAPNDSLEVSIYVTPRRLFNTLLMFCTSPPNILSTLLNRFKRIGYVIIPRLNEPAVCFDKKDFG